jgi:hypothetical protein
MKPTDHLSNKMKYEYLRNIKIICSDFCHMCQRGSAYIEEDATVIG